MTFPTPSVNPTARLVVYLVLVLALIAGGLLLVIVGATATDTTAGIAMLSAAVAHVVGSASPFP